MADSAKTIDQSISGPLYKSLEELGVSEHEKKLYLLSLSLGPCSIAKLAETMNVARPNLYKVIQGLEKHGLAEFSEKKGYSKQFIVESPSKITELLKVKHENLTRIDRDFTQVLPDIIAMHKQGDLPTKVKILQKREDLLAAFEQIFNEVQDTLSVFGSSKDMNEFISHDRLEKQIRKRIRRGIKARLLFFPDEDAIMFKKRDAEELRETRFLVGFKPFSTGFYLFSNKVIIWQPKTPLAVLIEDEYIVAMLQSIYGVLWESAAKALPVS